MYNAGGSAVGPFRWVQFVNDTVLSAISAPNLTDSGSKLITITIPAGFGLGGTINSFTVTSGVVIGTATLRAVTNNNTRCKREAIDSATNTNPSRDSNGD